MKRVASVTSLIVICFVAASHTAGQVVTVPDVEYGDVSELVGTNRVFVDSDDYKAREHILREIARHSRLLVVGRIEDAEFVLKFGSQLTSTNAPSANDFIGGESPMTAYGDMVAYRMTEGPTRLRICWSARKKRVSLNAPQLVGQFFLRQDDPKSNLLGLVLSLIPRGGWKFGLFHLNRAPEVNATRDFLKALMKAGRIPAEYNHQAVAAFKPKEDKRDEALGIHWTPVPLPLSLHTGSRPNRKTPATRHRIRRLAGSAWRASFRA